MSEGKYKASEQGSTAGTAVTFLLIGLGAGALVGLLLAPKTGKQMRKDLRRKYEGAKDTFEDWRDDAKEFAENAKEFAEDAIERGERNCGRSPRAWWQDCRGSSRPRDPAGQKLAAAVAPGLAESRG